MEIVPCSRVGHVFRNSVPYSFPSDRKATVLRNLARVAHVWMDEYKDFFFASVVSLTQLNLEYVSVFFYQFL